MHNLDKKLIALKTRAQSKLLSTKKPGGKEIIMEIVLIVIGVAVAIIFRDKIIDIVTNMAGKVEENISGIFGTT